MANTVHKSNHEFVFKATKLRAEKIYETLETKILAEAEKDESKLTPIILKTLKDNFSPLSYKDQESTYRRLANYLHPDTQDANANPDFVKFLRENEIINLPMTVLANYFEKLEKKTAI